MGPDGESVKATAGLSRRQIARVLEVPVGRTVWPGVRLTRAGMGFVAMLLILGLVAANPGLNLLLLLFGLGVGLVLFNMVAARRQVGAAHVRRIVPDVAAAGRPATIRYEITNRSNWLAVRALWVVDDVGDGRTDPAVLASLIEEVPPRGTRVAEVPFVPLRRGVLQLAGLRLASKSPFGLVKRLRNVRREDRFLVWPALWQPRIEWLSRAPRAPQVRQSRNGTWHPGVDEFFGIREYRPGDNTRLIHWRRSAVFDRVLVREMAEASPGHVTLALETMTAGGPADSGTLDDLVSAAASLACDALERGWHVGLIANGRPCVVLPPAGGRAVRSRLLYELATLAAAERQRLAELLEHWPGGPGWTGRAVLLHPNSRESDGALESVAARLAAEVGPLALVGPADLDAWFDRTAPRRSLKATGTSPAQAAGTNATGAPPGTRRLVVAPEPGTAPDAGERGAS